MKQKIFMTLSILTICFLFTGCGKKSAESQLNDTTWYYSFYNDLTNKYCYDYTLTINKDGTADFISDGDAKSATWKLNDKESVISFNFSLGHIDYRLNYEKNKIVSITPISDDTKFEDFYCPTKDDAAKMAKSLDEAEHEENK